MKKRMLVVALSMLVALSMVSFSLADQKKPEGPPPVVKEMVTKAKAGLKAAKVEEMKAVIDKKSKAILLDVRTSGEWAAGHLPGVVHVDRGLLEFAVWQAIPDQNADIIVYCKSGSRATLATRTLVNLGYKNARLADMHYVDWVKAANPVAR